MAVPSSLDRSARLRFAFREAKDLAESSRQSGGLSTVNRLSSPILRSVASPVNRIANVQSPEPSMIDEIVFQCRRINPDFSASSGSLNLSVSQTLKKAVDTLVDSQVKSRPGDNEKLREMIADLNLKLDDANRKLQVSLENEKKYSIREERFALEEIKLLTEKKHLQNEKNQINTLKKNYLQLEAELKLVNEELRVCRDEAGERENRIQELMNENLQKEEIIEELRNKEMPELSKIEEFKRELEIQTDKIIERSEQLESKEIILQTRESKLQSQELTLSKDLQSLEDQKKEVASQLLMLQDLKLKLKQESDFFEASNKELAAFKVTIEIEQNKLKEQKQALDQEKSEIAATQRALTSQKSQLLEEVEDFEQQKLAYIRSIEKAESTEQGRGCFTEQSEIYKPADRETLEFFPHFRSLLSDTVTELARRTLFIEKWTNSLKDREVTFESRLDDVKLVLALLIEKSHNFDHDLNEFEPLLSVIKDMLAEISTKKLILEEDSQVLAKEILESCGESYLGKDTQILNDLLNDFELKANELLLLDEHLMDLQDKLNAQVEENARVARFLMEDRLEFENEKVENKREIEDATERLLQIQRKADLTLEQMSKKEKEVLALQQTIDCRSPFSEDF